MSERTIKEAYEITSPMGSQKTRRTTTKKEKHE